MNQKTKRRKTMSKKEIEGIEKIIKEYLKKNLRMESRVRYVVGLSQPGIGKKNWLVHRLVALVYIPNPERLPYVCHKDNVPTNNRVENLYWGTQKDNMSQASRDGRMIQAKGADSVHYKGTEIQRSYIPRLIEVGFTIKEIAEMMGFGICLVRDYYNNYRNLTQGTHYYIHSKRKNKS